MPKKEQKLSTFFHPGYYIQEIIDEKEISQAEFAERLTLTPKNLSDLLHGKASISQNIAEKLSLMLGTSVEVWLNLQKKYEEKLIEQNLHETVEKEAATLAMIDYNYFVKLGVVKPVKERNERVTELFRYFGIASFEYMHRSELLPQFRLTSALDEKHRLNANLWVQTVINFGKEMRTSKYQAAKLKSILPQIRQMTGFTPAEFQRPLEKLLAEAGIGLVLLPSLKNSGVYGVTLWLNRDKVVIGMTNRGKKADIFWFSLFHEIGHVLEKRSSRTYVEMEPDAQDPLVDATEEEKAADAFARDYLIPVKDYERFVKSTFLTESAIVQFADQLGIHPGIVVGRLQKEERVPYSQFNHLKMTYTFEEPGF